MKFDGFDSTDPTKKAVLTDATYAMQAVIELEAKTYTKVTPNFSRFFTGSFGAEYADSLLSQGAGGKVVTGIFCVITSLTIRQLVTGTWIVFVSETIRVVVTGTWRAGIPWITLCHRQTNG